MNLFHLQRFVLQVVYFWYIQNKFDIQGVSILFSILLRRLTIADWMMSHEQWIMNISFSIFILDIESLLVVKLFNSMFVYYCLLIYLFMKCRYRNFMFKKLYSKNNKLIIFQIQFFKHEVSVSAFYY